MLPYFGPTLVQLLGRFFVELKDLDITKRLNKNISTAGDPDRYSKELKEYHRVLWSNRKLFSNPFTLINGDTNKLIYDNGDLTIVFTPDSITNSFYGHKRRKPIIDQYCEEDSEIRSLLNEYFDTDYIIGSSILFPTSINGVFIQKTLNIKRGISKYIRDRFDYTLECIKRYYDVSNRESPLLNDIEKNREFFDLFHDFKTYVDFFFLNDLVDANYNVMSFTNVIDFEHAYPRDRDEYKLYLKNMMDFYKARNERIGRWIEQWK